MITKMKEITNVLIDKIYQHMEDLDYLRDEELGEVIDMIKDLSSAMYYCSMIEQK